MTDPVPGLAGVVLAGGRSTRMGRPKAWLRFGEELLLHRVLGRVRRACDPVVVVGAPDQDLPPLADDVRIARDAVEDRGPLQGIAAGLEALAGEDDVAAAFVTSCDVPFLRPEVIGLLEERRRGAGADAAVAHTDGHHHVLCATYSTGVLDHVHRLLAEDRRRPFFLFEAVRVELLGADDLRAADPDLETLLNCNTPEDHAAALERAGLPPDAVARDAAGEAGEAGEEGDAPQVVWELYGVPRVTAGRTEIPVAAATLGEALAALEQAVPDLRGRITAPGNRPAAHLQVSRDGREFLRDPEAALSSGDRLLLLAADAGG